jgi:hypothetical protein
MSNKIAFNDLNITEHPLTKKLQDNAKRLLDEASSPILRIGIDATHSGKLINQRVYPSSKVKPGVKSFFSKDNGGSASVNKPVLTYHNDYSDPIGRVIKAKFTPLKNGDDLKLDYLNPDIEPSSEGSGVVSLIADIVDPDAIAKIIDERYISVSSGHSTDRMICSICAGDLMGFDACEHWPGKFYDKDGEPTRPDKKGSRQCYGITNNMTYHEISFVNIPADDVAKVISINNQDSWQDFKDHPELIKDKALISCQTTDKSSIKDLILVDDERELSLLSSTPIEKKTSINIPPETASKLKKIFDEAIEVESQKDQSKEESVELIQPNQDDDINKEGDKTMDKDVVIDPQEFERIKTEKDGLASDLQKVTDEKQTLTNQVTSKDQEIQDLKDQLASISDELKSHLAKTLASYRIRLDKPDTSGLDSEDSRKEYEEKLAKRSVESLKDALADILPEVEAKEEGKSSADILADDKIEDPTLKGKNGRKDLNDLDSLLD